MENINKNFYPKFEKEKLEKERKKKSVFQKLRKKALAATLSSFLVSAPSLKAKSVEAIFSHPETPELTDILRAPQSEAEEIKINTRIFEESPEKIINKLNYIIKKTGFVTAYQLGCIPEEVYDLDNRPEAKERLVQKLNQKPETKGEETKEPAIMDSLKEIGLEPEIVKKVLKTLPPSWVKEIALINYLDKSIETAVNERTGEKQELVAHHQSKGGAELSEICFVQGAKQKKPSELLTFLILECAHVKNWKHNGDLSLAERTSLLYEVIKRVESKDRFRHEFVESIERKDKGLEIIKKSIEYWAIICRWVMTRPADPTISMADKKLVFSYLALTDPEYNPLKNCKLRNELIINYEKGIVEKKGKKA